MTTPRPSGLLAVPARRIQLRGARRPSLPGTAEKQNSAAVQHARIRCVGQANEPDPGLNVHRLGAAQRVSVLRLASRNAGGRCMAQLITLLWAGVAWIRSLIAPPVVWPRASGQ